MPTHQFLSLRRTLFNTIFHHQFEKLSRLIERGAEINVSNHFGHSLLHAAIRHGTLEMVQLLIRHGANIMARDLHLNTPLHHAAFHGQLEMVNNLIAHQAELNARNLFGLTPLYDAINHHHTSVSQALIKAGANIYATDMQGNTLLHDAAFTNNITLVTILLQAGLDINASNQLGFTPLYSAVSEGNINIVHQLIEAGADIHQTNAINNTPMAAAINQNHQGIIHLLRLHGASSSLSTALLTRERPLISGRESIQLASVENSIVIAAQKLKKYYAQQNLAIALEQCLDWAKYELSNWANRLPTITERRQAKVAQTCLLRLAQIDYYHPLANISLKEAISLVWCAIHDTQLKSGAPSERLTQWLPYLYEIQRGNNINNSNEQDIGGIDIPICIRGSFNKLISALEGGRHPEVEICFINAQTIAAKTNILIDEAFQQLSATNQIKTAQHWSITSGMPNFFIKQVTPQLKQQLYTLMGNNTGKLIDNHLAALEYLPPTPAVIAKQSDVALTKPNLLLFRSLTLKTTQSSLPNEEVNRLGSPQP